MREEWRFTILFFNKENQLIKEISADIIEEGSYAEFEPFVYFGDGAEKVARNMER